MIDKEISNKKALGKYGRMRLNYLKRNERVHYNALLIKNELYDYLLEIEQQAYELHDKLLEQYKVKWDITEKLKEKNQMKWIREMEHIYTICEGIINNFIYL